MAAEQSERSGAGTSNEALWLESLPESVVGCRPAALRAPLLERRGPGQRARFAREHVEVVLEVEHLAVLSVTALVRGHALPLVPDLDREREDANVGPRPRVQRR